jgi:DNA-binding IclR family transcriptional regulator
MAQLLPRVPGIQSVSRACRILLAVADCDLGLSAREVAKLHSLTLPTTYNLLTTLCNEGYLVKRANHRFVLGPARHAFAESLRRNPGPSDRHLGLLRELSEATGETTYLSAWQGNHVVILASVEGTELLRVPRLRPGFSGHMHARASAKLMLAMSSKSHRDQVIGEMRFERLTRNTITERDGLEFELDEIGRDGVAYDRQEYHTDLAGISAPILEAGHVVASLTIAVPAERFARNSDRLRTQLVAIAQS